MMHGMHKMMMGKMDGDMPMDEEEDEGLEAESIEAALEKMEGMIDDIRGKLMMKRKVGSTPMMTGDEEAE